MDSRYRMRERYVLRADRSGFGYREILELTPGGARLLVPDRGRRTAWWIAVSVAVAAELVAALTVLNVQGPSVQASLDGRLGPWWGDVLFFILPWIAPVATAVIADRLLPAFLARRPADVLPLEILGSESFGFFQELRARGAGGPVRITVDGWRKGVERALRGARSGARPPA